MEFRLLGPVDVCDSEGPLPLGGPKPRILLAALLLDHDRVVPAARLVDAIWGDAPPPTARNLLQTYVAGLRRTLDARGKPDLIRTRTPGYVLTTDPDSIDRYRFERLARQGREAAAAGRLDEADRDLRAALALWRGPALSGISSELLDGEAAALDELRLAVLEDRVGVDLAAGRHEDLVAELTAVVSRHPVREALRGQLMLALYRSGRQAEALTVYRDGRRAMIDELGIEPGHALKALHDAILRDDGSLRDTPTVVPVTAEAPVPTKEAPVPTKEAAVPTTGPHLPTDPHLPAEPHPPAAAPVPAGPAQLPAVPADFVGRKEQIDRVARLLAPGTDPISLPIAVIAGQGGVGKSTLAARVGHALAAGYPDGQLFVQLHGMTTTPVPPESALSRFLVALGDPVADLPSTLEGLSERYRSLLAGRRVLVVLDDAANENQIRPLLPGAASCAVLVTSRSRLPGLAGANLVDLETLTPDEARDLLVSLAGADRIEADQEAATRLAELCGQLPLAVRVAGTRLANRRHWSIGQFIDRLADEQRRLDELRAGDQEVRASISLSYQALDDTDRAALRRLGALGLPNFPAWIVAALLDTTETAAEDAIERLVDGQLVSFARIDEAGQTRYQIHDLVRLYAAERAIADEEPAARSAAVARVIDTWLSLVERIGPTRSTWAVGPAPDHSLTAQRVPATAAIASERPRAWFDAEEHSLISSVEQAAAMNLDVCADLASALCRAVFSTDNLFSSWNRTHDAALAAVRRTGNRRAEATLLAEFGQLRYEQDRFAEARTCYLQALDAFRELGDSHGEATTLAAIGAACREQGYLPEALHFLGGAQTLLKEVDDRAAAASVARVAGSVHLELGDFEAARRQLVQALAGFRALDSRRGLAMTLRSISLVHRARGDYERALRCAARARAICAEIGDELLEAYSVRAMAKAQIRLGRAAEALGPLEDVLRVCRTLHDRFGEALTLRTLGDLYLTEGRLGEAEEHLEAALYLWQVLDLPVARARTLRDLARLSRARGDDETAAARYEEAVDIARQYGAREADEITAERAGSAMVDASSHQR
jgi:DNA-binding SARP family transcriptional activator/tetratricopeptide (TPR) repeat protein